MELLNSSDDSRKKSCPSAEEVLKHLLWLLDSEAVFEAALGLYDLNLAATTYLCCCKLEKASKAYRECGDWSGVLRVGALMKLGEDEILKLAYELCEEVNALGKPGEAAKIALEYCRDISGGVNLLINLREWEEALRVAFLHTADGLISVVKNSALECASGLVGEFKESIEKVGIYLTRYLAVRQRRLLLAAKLKSEERSVIDLDDDTASEPSI